MKSFKSNAWMLPQPVLIIGTYDKDGRPNAMNAAWGGQWDMHEIMISLGSHQTTDNLAYDPVHHNYIKLGNIEGKAFSDGKQLNKSSWLGN